MKSDKIIIHNYTELNDSIVLNFIHTVINNGEISYTKKNGKQYCFLTMFPYSDNIIVDCTKRNNTHTFKVYKSE